MRFTRKSFLLIFWLVSITVIFALAVYDAKDVFPVVFSDLALKNEAFLPVLPKKEDLRAVHIPYGDFSPSKRDDFFANTKDSQLNGAELTIKDEAGRVAFFDRAMEKDVQDFVMALHGRGFYAIARVVVFQDARILEKRPELALRNAEGSVWKTYAGAAWTDPTNLEVCKYNIAVAKKALAVGFDEINFDYIRFPSDGPMESIVYGDQRGITDKPGVLESCFALIREGVGQEAVLSIDVFGMTFVFKDIGIGQVLERAAKYFDVIAPMSYPSHYPSNFIGYENPALYPYEVVAYTLEKGLPRLYLDKTERGGNEDKDDVRDTVVVRPWIQDFDRGAIYDIPKIQAQIKAAEDKGIATWVLWNAGGVYTYEAIKNK